MAPWSKIRSLDDIPDEIEVRVDYYRKNDFSDLENAMKDHLTGRLHSTVELPAKEGAVIKIPKSEFLAYWLFEDKDPSEPSMESFEAISDSVEDALPDLKNHFEVLGENVRAKPKTEGSERPNDISTRLGVTIGLCVTNKIVGLTRADWDKIAKTSVEGVEEKRLDYQLAATPVGYIAVENKGSITKNNRLKKGLRDHELSIIAKKDALRAKANPGGVLVGAIAVADSRNDSHLKCWLLDPPHSFPDNLAPDVFKILNRLRFQRSLTQIVFPKWESLHEAMERREEEIRREGGTVFFEGQALKYPSGNQYRLKWKGRRKVHAMGKNGLWVGTFTRLKQGHILFVGLGRRWVEAAIRQQLGFLNAFDGTSASGETMLEWDASSDELGMLSGFKFSSTEGKDGFTHVILPAVLHETRGGFAFALIENRRKVIRARNFKPLIPRPTELK